MIPEDFGRFRELLPIAVSQTVGDLTLSLVSIERYDHGSVLNFALSLREGRSFDLATVRGPRGPELEIQAVDDSGTVYRARADAGNGTENVWRLGYRLDPGFDARARLLDIRIPAGFIVRYLPERPRPEVIERWPGPWDFRVSLGEPDA
jgi:hypothetical protein